MSASPGDRDDRPHPRDPAIVECLDRTRRDVLAVLLIEAMVIVAGSLVLRLPGEGIRPDIPERAFTTTLMGLVLGSVVLKRALSSRSALRDPSTRADRFRSGHVAGAVLGGLAAPVGLIYAMTARPPLAELAPFWVAALATAALSLPRAHELDDFEKPMTPGWPDPSTEGPSGP
jgi:hypothetical protein